MSLVNKLTKSDRCVNNLYYLWGIHTLHTIYLLFSALVEAIMWSGGLKKRTLFQLLHTAYSLKNLYSSKVWVDLWTLATGTTWKYIACLVLSRWKHVSDCTRHMHSCYNTWIVMSQYSYNLNNVETNKNGIVSYLYLYLYEDMLRTQLLFTRAFAT